MLKFVFCATFFFHAYTSGFYQKSWLDDIDGPNFLRGAEQQIQNDKELDTSNDLPSDLKRVASDEIITTASAVDESIICHVAAHPNGTKTTKWDTNKATNPVWQKSHEFVCHQPFPTMVKLDRPLGVTYLPATVLLHRCVGYCSSQDLQNCTVVGQEEVVLTVLGASGSSHYFKNITVYNHTQCGCACMKRKSDCNVTIHDYDSDSCSCKCKKALINSCNPAIQNWDSTKCECVCKSAAKICDQTTNHEWNKDICDCDCKQKVKDRCVRKNKVLNKSKCECECPTPLPTCAQGFTFLKYNCTCVQDTSVITK
ncbi:hypothetical protein ACROYT_G029433 [Oculina patagonica]